MKPKIQQALVLVLVVIFNIGAVEAQPYEFQGHTYFLTSAGTWAEAEAEAVSHGGHLVSVNDAAEQDFINGMLSGSTWIGFTDCTSHYPLTARTVCLGFSPESGHFTARKSDASHAQSR